ncbi:MAG TPA: glycosyltransferase family 2 protein [Chloroflexi bacterium]|nr:glycosyltransferase family 2 protein [Chloroflexota bacterium]
MHNQPNTPQIGIAIAVHNNIERTQECLEAIKNTQYSNLFTCVVDDGSTDNTWNALQTKYPWVKSIHGDGNLWWTGGTNLAIRQCFEAGCEYVLLLNPDCIVYPNTISHLVQQAERNPQTVVASVVVEAAAPDTIWWAGTTWGPIKWLPLIWLIRYQYRRGQQVSDLPTTPFPTTETGGRGVLIPRSIFDVVGLFDELVFPHYAADNDFGLRVHKAGYGILIEPSARVRLYAEQTGLKPAQTFSSLWSGFMRRMFSRKHGEALHCAWHFYRRHVPWYAFIPSFIAVISWTTYKYWSESLLTIVGKRSAR